LLAEKQVAGKPIIDLTESNPTQCGFLYPEQEICTALSDESVLLYQPEPRGLLTARIAIAEYYAKLGISVVPEQIILTASTSEAYSFLFKLLCNVGDEVIVPQPSYPLFEFLCQLNDVTLRHYRLAYDGEWHIDFESLETNLTNRTKAVVLVHPNNPTGSYLKQDEFERISSLSIKNHYAVIVDEVFGPYNLSSDDRRLNIMASPSSFPLFSINGISKLLGLPQFKLSWIIVNGSSQQNNETLTRLDIIADTFLSVNTPVQTALPNLLQHASSTTEQIRSRVQKNFQSLQKIFTDSSSSVFRIEGGWYAILQLLQTHSDDDWAYEILAQQNILVYPGHFFDLEQKSCIIVCLLPISDIFVEAVHRIRQFTEETR
jgi:aspartate/methionine/tyrosine aminotransferase